ncbi:MAG TPA: aspartyl protease family protein [Allosphingosinicella sp.]|nr:aspartyl protease family protein [Allosphingosinicella sp.]
MLSRRALLGSLAALPLLGSGRLGAQNRRVGGARIVVLDNRVWMQVKFGPRGPYAFVIDTGAFTNLIRRDLVRELGLRQIGDQTLRGVGGSHQMGLYEGRAIALGTTTIGDLDFAAYEHEDLGIHREAMGALSTAVLTVADSELDFSQNEWRIYPDGRGARPGYERLESEISRAVTRVGAATMHVEAAIGGQTYRLQVDTGAPGQVLLWPRAARRSGLWNDATPYSPGQRRGIGGVGAASRLVRAPEIRIGSLRFERPLVSLTDPDSRDALPSDGLLGIGVIERMNWSTEIGAGKIWAKASGLPARPERYGMAGTWLEERQGKVVVALVSPRSPAADAGLRPGDEIEGIGFQALIARLGGRVGDRIPVSYRRGGQAHRTEIALRDFL